MKYSKVGCYRPLETRETTEDCWYTGYLKYSKFNCYRHIEKGKIKGDCKDN